MVLALLLGIIAFVATLTMQMFGMHACLCVLGKVGIPSAHHAYQVLLNFHASNAQLLEY